MGVPGTARVALDAVVAEHRGVVDQERDRPQRFAGAAHEGGGLGLMGKLGDHRRGLAAQGGDLGGQLFGVGGVAPVVDGDVIAGLGGGQGHGPADPAGRPGDERRAAHPGRLVDAAELDPVEQGQHRDEGDDADGGDRRHGSRSGSGCAAALAKREAGCKACRGP